MVEPMRLNIEEGHFCETPLGKIDDDKNDNIFPLLSLLSE